VAGRIRIAFIFAVVTACAFWGARSGRLFAQPATTAPLAETIQKDMEQLSATLFDESAKQEERDESARRLIARQTPQANEILRNALVSAGNRGAQLAAARALGTDNRPDPNLIDPLFALLGPDRALTEAAAQALTQYKGDSGVISRLIRIVSARQQPEAVRGAVARALGTFLDKRAAQTLIELLRGDESQAMHTAAAAALMEMTGLVENGQDVQKWEQWWNSSGGKDEADWRLALLTERAGRLAQVERRYSQLTDEVRTLLADQYQILPAAQQAAMILRYLRSSEPVIRSVGARLVFDDAVNNHTISAATREQLRKMVGDSSPQVRIEVAGALRALNDANALDALLSQSAQETDPDVRAALARAIGPIRDLRALPEMQRLVHDPSYAVAAAAAEAIAALGPQIRAKDPALALKTANDLKQILETRTGDAGSLALREAVVEAMGSLREPTLLSTFYTLLRPRESTQVRRSALKALGDMRDPNSVDLVINSLDDPDASVRLEAVEALGKVGSFEHAQALYRRLNPAEESDSSVRERAWRVLQALLPAAPKDQLSAWADRFNAEPSRRLIILKSLADKQLKDKEDERLAYTRQNIGETLMLLSQPADAAGYFRDALDYWNSRGRERMVNEGLISQLLGALLKARQYAQAAEFGSKLIKEDVGQQQTVGPALRTEAERLRDANDLKAALELIGEAKKMNPPLSPRYFRDLEDIESEVRRRMATDARPTSGPQSARGNHAERVFCGGRITSTFVATPSTNSIAMADDSPGSSG
jgi:HEAT repeat protein